jgi:hypothetical protein
VDYLQQYFDLSRRDIEPEIFTIALAVRYIRELINHGGSDMRRPVLESALPPGRLESFLACAVEIPWKDARLAQEWRKLQQVLPRVREAWEKGQSLFQEALERAKSDQESMEYFSIIDIVVDCYAEWLPLGSISIALHSGTGQSMDICSHAESTSSSIKRGRSIWKGVSDDILF